MQNPGSLAGVKQEHISHELVTSGERLGAGSWLCRNEASKETGVEILK